MASDVFVKDLELDFGDLPVKIGDNYLDLVPGREEFIAVFSARPTTPAALRKALRLRWMR